MKLNSLRVKFLAGFLTLFLGSFIVFFAVSYYMSSRALYSDADEISKGIGRSTALEIEKIYQAKKMTIEDLAHNPAIISGDRTARIQALAEAYSIPVVPHAGVPSDRGTARRPSPTRAAPRRPPATARRRSSRPGSGSAWGR